MLITPLLSLLAPHECLGCGNEGVLLCKPCAQAMPRADSCCYVCHRPDPASLTCPGCRLQSDVSAVYAAYRYEGLAKDLLWKLKFGRARAAGREAGNLLALYLSGKLFGSVVVTHIPTANSRVRQRGYDQAALIGKAFAAKKNISCAPLLARHGSRKQVGSSRAVRASQLQGAFRPVRSKLINGAHIILVDDVVTTGATLQEAAKVLKAAGARRVDAVVFAQA